MNKLKLKVATLKNTFKTLHVHLVGQPVDTQS